MGRIEGMRDEERNFEPIEFGEVCGVGPLVCEADGVDDAVLGATVAVSVYEGGNLNRAGLEDFFVVAPEYVKGAFDLEAMTAWAKEEFDAKQRDMERRDREAREAQERASESLTQERARMLLERVNEELPRG